MNRSIAMEPEYILEDSVETTHMVKQLLFIGRVLLALEVDLVVLSRQRKLQPDMLDRITSSVRELRQLVQEQV